MARKSRTQTALKKAAKVSGAMFQEGQRIGRHMGTRRKAAVAGAVAAGTLGAGLLLRYRRKAKLSKKQQQREEQFFSHVEEARSGIRKALGDLEQLPVDSELRASMTKLETALADLKKESLTLHEPAEGHFPHREITETPQQPVE